MAANIKTAFANRIEALDWMDPATKQQAKAKLDSMHVSVGYPDKWPHLGSLKIEPDNAYANRMAAIRFKTTRALSKLGKPQDSAEWWMNPQTVNAVNLPVQNALNFPAAIFQPPFYDPNADAAFNYGAIGSVIGHEISHSFDSSGAAVDQTGKLRNWWKPADLAHFKGQSQALIEQYNGYEPLPGLHVNGELTLGENGADVAGLAAAYDAYRASLGGKELPVNDGLTGDQRFFVAYGQAHAGKTRDGALRKQIVGNAPRAGHDARSHGPQHRRLVQGVRREAGRQTLPRAREARGSSGDRRALTLGTFAGSASARGCYAARTVRPAKGRGLVQQSRDLLLGTSFTLPLLAAVAAGLLIGIERGWRQRDEPDGTRVAGVRTFTLIGGAGGLTAVVARAVSPLVAAVVAAGMVAGLLRRVPAPPRRSEAARRDDDDRRVRRPPVGLLGRRRATGARRRRSRIGDAGAGDARADPQACRRADRAGGPVAGAVCGAGRRGPALPARQAHGPLRRVEPLPALAGGGVRYRVFAGGLCRQPGYRREEGHHCHRADRRRLFVDRGDCGAGFPAARRRAGATDDRHRHRHRGDVPSGGPTHLPPGAGGGVAIGSFAGARRNRRLGGVGRRLALRFASSGN